MKGNLLLKNSGSCFNHRRILLSFASLILLVSAHAQPKTALLFDGVDDYVTLPNILTPSYTKEAWVYAPLDNGAFNNNNIVSGTATAFWFPGNQGFHLSAGHTSPYNEVQDPDPLLPNTWYHVAVTYDAATFTMNLYKNGVLVATNTSVNNHSESTLEIGAFLDANFMKGMIDEVRIWSVPLSQAEIRDWMCKKVTNSHPQYANLLAYYKADEGTGTTLSDSKNTNDGTLLNGTAWATSGAALGDASVYDYSGAGSTATITYSATGESFSATNTSGTPDGIQVYRVDAVPDNTTGISGLGANNKYFGVFQVGGTSPTYTAVYDYGTNWSDMEATLTLYKRPDNTANWTDAGATQDMTANTLTATGQSTEYILGSVGTPLPVNFLSFSVTKENKGAKLAWSTASEMNNKGFSIMRSANGTSWSEIGFVEGNTNSASQQDYYFIDPTPVNGLNYYQLKQVDIDGSVALSEIRTLNFSAESRTRVYPVPARNSVTIDLGNGSLLNTEASIIDLQGRVVRRFTITQLQKSVSVADLKKGLYTIQFADGTNCRLIKE